MERKEVSQSEQIVAKPIRPSGEGRLPRFFPMIPAAEKTPGIFSRRDILPTLALAIGAVAGSGQFYADDPSYVFRTAVDLMTDHNCTTISSDASSRARVSIEMPDDEGFVGRNKRLEKAFKGGNLERIHKRYDQLRSYIVEKASENGLTLIDSDEELDQVNEAQGVDEVLTVLNSYGINFGITFGIPSEKPLADFGMEYTAIDTSTLDLEQVKIIARNTLTSLSLLPAELIRLGSPRRVTFVKDIDKSKLADEGVMANGITESRSGIFLDFNASLGLENFGRTFAHELGHKIDFVICGQFGAYQDKELKELNPEGRKYTANYPNPDGFTLTEYGATSVLEDKAEMMMNMFYALLNPSEMSEAVGEKYELVLARLEDNLPGISAYFRAISVFGSERRS